MHKNIYDEEIKILTGKDTVRGYELFIELTKELSKNNKYYGMIDRLIPLLKSNNAYVRIRSFCLLCYEARWDDENRLDDCIDEILMLLNDEKPVVVRKCIEALHELLIYKDYSSKVEKALGSVDLSKYKDSMKPLIQKDIAELKKSL